MAREFGAVHPEVEVLLTDDIGELPVFMDLLFEREREAVDGAVAMNCDACKWRRAGLAQEHSHGHEHSHDHGHGHGHDSGQEQQPIHDLYADLQSYHDRIWKPL
jgi:sirohydrochlorin cobaltochelatase